MDLTNGVEIWHEAKCWRAHINGLYNATIIDWKSCNNNNSLLLKPSSLWALQERTQKQSIPSQFIGGKYKKRRKKGWIIQNSSRALDIYALEGFWLIQNDDVLIIIKTYFWKYTLVIDKDKTGVLLYKSKPKTNLENG